MAYNGRLAIIAGGIGMLAFLLLGKEQVAHISQVA
jgi:hypothetical protein